MKIGVIEFLFIYYLNKTEINQIYVICAFRKLAVFFFLFILLIIITIIRFLFMIVFSHFFFSLQSYNINYVISLHYQLNNNIGFS